MKPTETELEYLERVEKFIRKALFPDQLKILDDGLALFKISLIEIFQKSDKLFDGEYPVLKSSELPELLYKTGLADRLYTLNEEEGIVCDKFSQLIQMHFPRIIEEFISEDISKDAAIMASKSILQTTEMLYDTFEEHMDSEKNEKQIVKRKRQIAELEELNRKEKNSVPKLYWNDAYDLNNFSRALKDKKIINNYLEFINIFKSQSICTIRNEMADFFVILIFKLLLTKPEVIKSGKKSGKGVKAIIDKFFRDDSIPVSKPISFRNRHNRIIQKGLEYDKLKEKAGKFLENHLCM